MATRDAFARYAALNDETLAYLEQHRAMSLDDPGYLEMITRWSAMYDQASAAFDEWIGGGYDDSGAWVPDFGLGW